MFITKEEADKRRGNSNNLFSPNYIPPEKSSPASEDVEDSGMEERTDSESVPSSEADEESSVDEEKPSEDESGPEPSRLDSLLKNMVDPYSVRQRQKNLRGQKDVQVAIGTSALLLGDATAGKVYGLSDSQAFAYRGARSSTSDITEGRPPDESRRVRLSEAKEILAEAAASKLGRALESLTDEKISDCSAIKASTIAKDMATVMDRVTRDNSMPESIHFHIFKPEMKTVRDYAVAKITSPLTEKPQSGGGAD
jgi:hypothetical protein